MYILEQTVTCLTWWNVRVCDPMRIRQIVKWSLDFFLCIHVILVRCSLRVLLLRCDPAQIPKFLQFFSLLLSEIQKMFIYSCLTGLMCGWFGRCGVMPWWKLSCKLWYCSMPTLKSMQAGELDILSSHLQRRQVFQHVLFSSFYL